MTIALERVATTTKPPAPPAYTSWGYIIMEDGTTHALHRQWWHGAVLCLLFPEEAKQAGYIMPDEPDEVNVFEFQKFELDNHDHFPVIRVCPTRMMGPPSFDRGCKPVTEAQMVALRLVVAEMGLRMNDEVSTDHKDMTVRKLYEYMQKDLDVWTGEKREVTARPLKVKGWSLGDEDE